MLHTRSPCRLCLYPPQPILMEKSESDTPPPLTLRNRQEEKTQVPRIVKQGDKGNGSSDWKRRQNPRQKTQKTLGKVRTPSPFVLLPYCNLIFKHSTCSYLPTLGAGTNTVEGQEGVLGEQDPHLISGQAAQTHRKREKNAT